MGNIYSIFFFISFIFLLHSSLFAQTKPVTQRASCATNFMEETVLRDRMFENRRNAAELLQRSSHKRIGNQYTIYVPIQFHLLGTENGTGYISKEKVLDALCYTNELYYKRPADILGDGSADDTLTVIFYLNTPFHYINNNILFNHSDPSIVSYLMSLNKVQGALNVFVGLTIPSSGGQGTTLAYYSGLTDCIYAIKSTINGSSATLAHEIGHYFSLAHPHYGWDGLDYSIDPTVIASGCAPAMTTNAVICEKVARSGPTENCQIAADGFCDTKPDYNFGIFSVCSNNIQASDPDCVPLPQPNTDNVMSYFDDACTNDFTPEQIRAVYLDLVSRGYIYNSPSGTIPITQSPVLVYPIDSQLSFYPSAIHLDWNGVYGATSYLVTAYEYLLGVQIQVATQQIVNTTDAWFVGLPNRVYGWKVKPLGTTDICNDFESELEFFITDDWALAVQDVNSPIFQCQISPNPVKSGNSIHSLQTEQSIQVSIFNPLGQSLMPPIPIESHIGQNQYQLALSNLTPGIYYICLASSENLSSHKIIVE